MISGCVSLVRADEFLALPCVFSLPTPDEGSFLLGSASDASAQAANLQGAEQRGGHQPRTGERIYPRGLGARLTGRSAAAVLES